METFITILAVVFILGSTGDIFVLLMVANTNPEAKQMIKLEKRLGGNLVWQAIRTPLIIFVVCLVWLVSLLFN